VRALYDEPCFAASGHRSLELWARWSAELGARLVEPIGVAYLDRDGEDEGAQQFRAWLDRGIENLRALDAATEEIAPAEAARRWPGMSPESLRRVVFEPAGGFGRSALATRTIAHAGLATGGVTHVGAAAERVIVKSAAARGLATADPSAEIAADAVVIAAGLGGVALVHPFVGDLGIRPLPHWTSYWDVPYPEGADLAMGRLPAWANLGALLYGFPDDGESGFKMAWHAPRSTAREHADGPPSAAQLEELRRAAEVRFPGLRRATCRGTFSCAYDATPDERFRIGPVPGVAGLYFVGGMSGHGFKHAPALGDAVAALVAGEEPETSLSPYALG
jgi:glycine/D-amino acid oxidase-like deaminating enzyme